MERDLLIDVVLRAGCPWSSRRIFRQSLASFEAVGEEDLRIISSLKEIVEKTVHGESFLRELVWERKKEKWDGENVGVLMQNANGKRGAMKGRTEKRGIVLMIR